jgi:hypothetical protein
MADKYTSIELPHTVLDKVGEILEYAGFTLEGTGGGTGIMERDGKIGKEEAAELTNKMAKALFEFEVDEVEFDYQSKEECIKAGDHLVSCDNDGFCNLCGHQESEDE